ncbi:p450 domain containing protein, partial [Asbolus verrucosus]
MLFATIILGTVAVLAVLYVIKKLFDYVVLTYYLQMIPGPPKGSLFFGNMEFHNKQPADIFNALREWASKYYPIYRLWICHISTVNILSPEDFETILSSIKHERKSMIYNLLLRWLKSGLLTSYGSKWQSRRKILTPAFHFSILQDFIAVFNEETENLVEILRNEVGKPSIDVVPVVSQFTLKAIGETAMGTKFTFHSPKEKNYKKAIYELAQVYLHRLFRPWLFYDINYTFAPSCFKERRLVNTLHSFTKEVIEKREKDFKSDDIKTKRKRLAMLDLLFSAKADGLIENEGIREEVDTFMFEGHDTTAVAISFSLMLIACHKEVQDQIVEEMRQVLDDIKKKPTFAELQEMKYLERCIKEALRLYPSVFFIGRVLGEDVITSSGYKLKKDSLVQLHIYDLHHNPEIYSEPEKFDPDRFLPENCQKRHPFAYVPFSAGPRNCIGQRFAILELKTVISGILANFVLEPVDTPETIVLIVDLVLRTKDGIRIKFLPRQLILSNPKHNEKSRLYELLHNWLRTGLLTSKGQKWLTRRRILTPAFHFSILQQFINVFNDQTDQLVETFKKQCHQPFITVDAHIAQFTLKTITETAMGVKLTFDTKEEIGYKQAVFDIGQIYLYRLLHSWFIHPILNLFSPTFFKERKTLKVLHRFTEDIIDKRQKTYQKVSLPTEKDDVYKSKTRLAMLDLLLTMKNKEGVIDIEGIREEVDTFVFEGHDTTAAAIGFSLMLIASHKHVQDQIVQEMVEVLGDLRKKPTYNDLQEMKYMERTIKEVLRLYPSVHFISRKLGEDVLTNSGYVLPKHTIVHLHFYDVHHNADIYPDPEKFDPDRFLPENSQNRHPFAYLPFSAGPRNCIGQRFAMLELKAVLCGVLANFILEAVDTPSTI